jgi:hypothetical protein
MLRPAIILITLLLAVPAMSVELFRYRGAAKDGGKLEYVFDAGAQSLTAWGLPGIGFLATGLVSMSKNICPIDAKATRKNHRHPIGAVKARGWRRDPRGLIPEVLGRPPFRLGPLADVISLVRCETGMCSKHPSLNPFAHRVQRLRAHQHGGWIHSRCSDARRTATCQIRVVYDRWPI